MVARTAAGLRDRGQLRPGEVETTRDVDDVIDIALLAEVAALKEKRFLSRLRSSGSWGPSRRLRAKLAGLSVSSMRSKRRNSLRDQLFAREEDEETIAVDEAHVPGDGEHSCSESKRQRAWRDRQKSLRTV
jgi:hypothetical protein